MFSILCTDVLVTELNDEAAMIIINACKEHPSLELLDLHSMFDQLGWFYLNFISAFDHAAFLTL